VQDTTRDQMAIKNVPQVLRVPNVPHKKLFQGLLGKIFTKIGIFGMQIYLCRYVPSDDPDTKST
jgi:hypothetical protein